jgi:uncharacterized protein CbrC (UPF0167 family)
MPSADLDSYQYAATPPYEWYSSEEWLNCIYDQSQKLGYMSMACKNLRSIVLEALKQRQHNILW